MDNLLSMEVKVSLSSRRPIGFLDIPLEIRHQVYQYCLVRKDPVNVHHLFIDEYSFSEWGIRDEKKSLLLVSTKIGFEASEVLYGDNVFKVQLHGEGGYDLKRLFTEANIRRIRKMQVVMQPQGVFYGHMLDSTLWSPILAELTKLSIVAQQPLQARTCFNAPSFEQEIEEWTEWLRAILQYIVRQLPSSCIVEADDDDRKETSAVMRQSLPSDYRKVQTLAGDFCFRRNDYSEESDYWDDEYDDHDIDSNASWLRLLLMGAITPAESD